jgi:hypothetical protein
LVDAAAGGFPGGQPIGNGYTIWIKDRILPGL